jgi:hypothetical protein
VQQAFPRFCRFAVSAILVGSSSFAVGLLFVVFGLTGNVDTQSLILVALLTGVLFFVLLVGFDQRPDYP